MPHSRSQLEKRETARRDIDHLLSDPLRDDEWDFLMEEYYVDEIVDSHSFTKRTDAVESAARKIRKIRNLALAHAKAKQEKVSILSSQEGKQSLGRSEAVSILIAQEASKDEDIRLFRAEVLGDTLLTLEEVDAWIQQQVQKEGPPTAWLEVPLSQTKTNEYFQMKIGNALAVSLSLEIPAEQIRQMRGIRGHILRYTVPDDEWERSVAVLIGGVLERLQQLSEQLENLYAWPQAQATTFILTGNMPWVSPFSYTLRRNSYPLLNRIILEVDPMVLPKVVTRSYSNLRKEMTPRRPRGLTEKHMQLALFASKHPNGKWAEKMELWNKEHPEWKYKAPSNFSHDCHEARRRLLFS